MKDDQLTELTAPHKTVLRVLEQRGLEVWWETEFPPYRVDLYLPRYHAAIEVDGPHHVKEKDDERDGELLEYYRLPVYHIPSRDAVYPDRWWVFVATFLNDARPSRAHRWASCEDEVPW